MDKFYTVIKFVSKSRAYHPDEDDAKKEAERLARCFPGQKFVVMESMGLCHVEAAPVKWESTLKKLPF